MKQHLKYILLLLVFIGTVQISIAESIMASAVNMSSPPTGNGTVVNTLGSSDYPESLVNDVNGNIYFLNRDNSSGNNIYTIKKLDIYGTITTQSTITSSSNAISFQVNNLKRDNNENFYYQTYEYNGNSQSVSINKIDANGNKSTLVSKTNAYFNSMNIDNAGNLYYILNENSNFYINKIEANGNSTNLLTSSGNYIYYYNLKIDLQGNIYFIKDEYSPSTSSSSNSLVKIDNAGNNMISLVSLSGTNGSSNYISRNINEFEILNSGEINFTQQNYYNINNQSTQSIQVKKINSYGIINVIYNDSVSNNNNYTYIQNSCKDNVDNFYFIKTTYNYSTNIQEYTFYQVDNQGNINIISNNNYNTWIPSMISDNIGNLYYSLPELHQIVKLNVGATTFISKWGLSPNGLKTQDNTIQLDINGKKGTSSPVNENGKVN
jgi:hypothetical protein